MQDEMQRAGTNEQCSQNSEALSSRFPMKGRMNRCILFSAFQYVRGRKHLNICNIKRCSFEDHDHSIILHKKQRRRTKP